MDFKWLWCLWKNQIWPLAFKNTKYLVYCFTRLSIYSLDLKDESIFRNPNPINVTFHDMKKIDLVNPVIGKLATQVKASKLTDCDLTKKKIKSRGNW